MYDTPAYGNISLLNSESVGACSVGNAKAKSNAGPRISALVAACANLFPASLSSARPNKMTR